MATLIVMLETLTPTPARTRVLHIGTMKSGTTAIQRAASQRRRTLLKHGVRYPGTGLNHYTPIAAFMGVRREGEHPDLTTWEHLLSEVEGDETNRVLISHEWACEADDATARRLVDALGERLHVVITLRPLTQMVGSYWQEVVKNGRRTSVFEQWLQGALKHPPGKRRKDQWDRQSDQAGIVERWERLLGPDRVTVVIADPGDPARVPATLEQLLDLPAGMLADSDADESTANRSLSPAEAEFFRRQNFAFHRRGVPFREFALAYRRTAVSQMLRTSPDLPDHQRRIVLPRWAAERATTYGSDIAERLRTSRAHFVGDLDTLHAPVTSAVDGPLPVPDVIPIDTAVEAVVASVLVGTGRAGKTRGTPSAGSLRADTVKARVYTWPGGPQILRGARGVRYGGHALTRRLQRLRARVRRGR